MRTTSGVSLQWLLPGSIVLSLVLLLSIVFYQGQRGLEAAMISAANETAMQLGNVVNERVGRLINPVESTVRLLAHDALGAADTLEQRLQRLPLLVEALEANNMLSAVYVGYATGEFLLVRPLSQGRQEAEFSAPEDGHYLVQSVSLGADGELRGDWLFYDAQLQLQESRGMPDYRFDPRSRPWYRAAERQRAPLMTRPYVFFTTREVGVTVALASLAGDAVIGLDASVDDLSGEVLDMRLTPGTEVAVVDGLQRVMAYPQLERIVIGAGDEVRLAHLDELGIAALDVLLTVAPSPEGVRPYEVAGQTWYGLSLPLSRLSASDARILMAIPADELLAGARQIVWQRSLWVLCLALVVVLAGWALGARIGAPLRALSDQLQALADFDFSHPPGVRSRVREVNRLSAVMVDMARAIDNFQAITLSLSREPRLEHMLEVVLAHLVRIAAGCRGVVYLCSDEGKQLQRAADVNGDHFPQTLTVDEKLLQQQPQRALENLLGGEQQALSLVLHDRHGVLLGLVMIELQDDLSAVEVASLRRFLQGLAGSLAVAIETRQLFEGQQRLLEAVIKLLADAIDAKSPYTAGHCERVPQLAEMLLDQALAQREGPFAEFQMDEDERYAFHIAAWLHDCGKVTSPEYVVDKATKLETLYNRLHEVRMRFEVLWRDAHIDYLQALSDGVDPGLAESRLQQRQQALQADFELVARANQGGESMSDADVQALQRVGAQVWFRHFDDRIGLSAQEQMQLGGEPASSLPARERLLADKARHILPWGERRPPVEADDPRNIWGFDMPLPEHSMNLGELYNLSTRRGTLTAEERFKINDHIVQTLIMLSSLPFPRALRTVPDMAANHHERLDGAGYPRRLAAKELDTPARVLAIADVFEALTAADRPYKEAKTLSESVSILCNMAVDGHLDAQLLALFLESGVYLDYGRAFLRAEQLDQVDVQHHVRVLRALPLLSESS